MAMPQRDNALEEIKRLEPPSRIHFGASVRCLNTPSGHSRIYINAGMACCRRRRTVARGAAETCGEDLTMPRINLEHVKRRI